MTNALLDHVKAEYAKTRIPNASRIETLTLDLSRIDNDGVLVNVDTQGFKSLDRKLTWKALGVTLPDNLAITVRAPHVGLLPDAYRLPITRAAGQAYEALQRWSMRLSILETMFGTTAYQWIPWTAFPKFEEDFNAALASLNDALDKVEADWPTIQARVVRDFLELARSAARRMRASGAQIEDDFEERVVSSLETLMPTPEGLRERLKISYNVGVITLSSDALAEQRRVLEEQQAIARGYELNEAEREERLAELQVKARLREMKLAAAEAKMSEALSPLEDGIKQLHAVVYEAVTAIAESVKKNGYLHGSSAKKTRDLAEWVTIMNGVFNDGNLATKIEKLEALASSPVTNTKRSVGPVEEALEDLKAFTYAAARDVVVPHRMNALEIL